MRLHKFLRRANSRKFPLSNLLDELFYMVLEQVDKRDFLKLCLVSRGLYLRIAPILYRNISLNLRRASNLQLLQRLSHPRTHLPDYIRCLKIFRPDCANKEQHAMIQALLSGMSNLQVLRWSDLDIPRNILDIMTTRFPNATLEISTQDEKIGTPSRWDIVPPAAHCLFRHPASSRLTRFEFVPTHRCEVYTDFKFNLVKMLKRSKHLVTFKLQIWEDLVFMPPEYPELFRSGGLPKLKHFTLQVQHRLFFTARELELWGNGVGWENLSVLELCFANLFEVFVGRALNLEKLHITLSERGDLHSLKLEHGNTVARRSFLKLRHFSFATPRKFHPPSEDKLPLEMLKWMPHVRSLDLFHQNPEIPATLQHEIQVIGKLMPDLEKFNLGLFSHFTGHHLLGTGILKDLAGFESLLILNIYASRGYGRKRLRRSQSNNDRIAWQMRDERLRLGLPWTEPFEMGFKHVYGHEDLRFQVRVPTKRAINYNCSLGPVTVPYDSVRNREKLRDLVSSDRFRGKRSPDELSLDELHEMSWKNIGGFGYRRGRYLKEIKRRERAQKVMTADDEYPTLYDALTQQGNEDAT